MNPLTLVKRIQNINSKEASLGISDEASWHAKYEDSAYVFVDGIPFDLTKGDLLAVFAQYGEVVDRAANTGWGAPEDMELERRDRRRREDTSLRKPDNDEFEPRTRDSDRWEEKRHKRQYDYGNR
ncbi:hypothetical protein K1719_026785 [Acacia pycnantha]|nr:hypothetical protein K1719_026785 [Acacia pycnantha]